VQVRGLSLDYKCKNAKESYKTHRSNTHVVDCESDILDDEEKEVYAAEFIGPSKVKPCSCLSLNLTQMSWQKEMAFTVDVSKCDHIFDKLLKN